jgi:NodT family efflux transporter outer membrane factor (OMF) lipoprotein
MPIPARPLAALFALALGGCTTVGPDFDPSTPAAPPDWSAWHGGAPELLAQRPAPGLPGAPAFGDPVLRTLLARAGAANHDLQTAALRFAQSRAQARIAAAQGGLQLNASAGVARQRQSESGASTRLLDVIAPANRDQLVTALSEPFNLYQAGFDASWELDLWGRVRRSVEAADAGSAAAAAALDAVRLSVAAELARHYFTLRGVQRQAGLLRAELAAAEETLELASARAEGGIGTDIDLARQRGQVADLRARLPGLLAQEAEAANQVTLLAGERPGALRAELAARAAEPEALGLPDLAPGLPSELAARRPDIRAAEARLHAATAGIGIARAELYPRITLGGRFGLESVAGGRFGDWGSRQWSIGPSLMLPLFDQGRRRAAVELRELEQQEAAVAYQRTVLKAWHEVDTALSAYSAAQQRQHGLDAKVVAGRAALALARANYAGGLSDLLPELDARRVLLQAQREQAQGETGLAIGLLTVYKTLGAAPL